MTPHLLVLGQMVWTRLLWRERRKERRAEQSSDCQQHRAGFQNLHSVQIQLSVPPPGSQQCLRCSPREGLSLPLSDLRGLAQPQEQVFSHNAPVTILRSEELCDQFTDQLLRDLIAKETIEGLGIFCYLASLFSSGPVAVSGLMWTHFKVEQLREKQARG